MLRLFSCLAVVSRITWNAVQATPEFTALRLAQFDVGITGVEQCLSRKESTILEEFDRNLGLFTRSWALGVEVPLRLRTSPLGDLHIAELGELRQILLSGW